MNLKIVGGIIDSPITDLENRKQINDQIINILVPKGIYNDKLKSLNLLSQLNGNIYSFLAILTKHSPEEIINNHKACIQNLSKSDITHYIGNWTFDQKNKVYIASTKKTFITTASATNIAMVTDKSGNSDSFESIRIGDKYITLLPNLKPGKYSLTFKWENNVEGVSYPIQIVPQFTLTNENKISNTFPSESFTREDISDSPWYKEVTIGNGKSAIARVNIEGYVQGRGYQSKRDALLMANLNPRYPDGDRKVLVKGSHDSVNIDGQWFDLNIDCLENFERYPLPKWTYNINGIKIEKMITMVRGKNITVAKYKALNNDNKQVTLHVRPHLVARGFHEVVNADQGLKGYWQYSTEQTSDNSFTFDPIKGGWNGSQEKLYNGTKVGSSTGSFIREDQWYRAEHSIDISRAEDAGEDIFSPGYFKIDISNEESSISYSADLKTNNLSNKDVQDTFRNEEQRLKNIISKLPHWAQKDPLAVKLAIASDIFVVDRDEFKTVIAGYPWFTDWGRDTFIAARGLLKAGMTDEVKEIILRFGQFEESGTLPNIILGETAGNRETVDAPLMYFVMLQEYIEATGDKAILDTKVTSDKTVTDVLKNIVNGYKNGICIIKRHNHVKDIWEEKFVPYHGGIEKESNDEGTWEIAVYIHMDPETGLIQSSSHSTWMDTNHPAGTPREGYPIEIQALWFNALTYLSNQDKNNQSIYSDLAQKTYDNFNKFYWNKDGYIFDSLKAGMHQSANTATQDPAFRSNQSMAVTMGLLSKDKAKEVVTQMYQKLVTPSGIRSLAEGYISADGFGYIGHYQGVEDADGGRKHTYHNGTSWGHPLGDFMVAYAEAFDYSKDSLEEMLSLFETVKSHLREAGVGNISEIFDGSHDGDRHIPRGCDEQAWAATELLRAYVIIKGQYIERYGN